MGLGTTIWSPLASGVLTGKYNHGNPSDTRLGIEGLEWLRDKNVTAERIDKARKIETLATELGTTSTKLSLAWCLKNPNVSTVILGASNETQLMENLEAMEIQSLLTSEVMERIERDMKNKPLRPDY
jgi:aryl-alcohol dehydrogenase-like predicted oxidoreductase